MNILKSKLMAHFKQCGSLKKTDQFTGIAIDFFNSKNMKTKTIVAGLVALAAGLTTYYIIKRKNRKTVEPVQRTHHLTDVFSKAKSFSK
jgi:hypothetical protein